RYEEALISEFSLNHTELTVIHSARQSFRTTLLQLRQSEKSILNKKTLAPADTAALIAVGAQRDHQIAVLAAQILNGIRPETAAPLRFPATLILQRSAANRKP